MPTRGVIDDAGFGEYRVVRPLGRGGMGLVYLGHDTVLDRPVAIKVLSAGAPSTAARERFLIEARAIARLAHPNVVAVYYAGETRDGRPFLVQELVRGHSLDRSSLPLPVAEVRRIGVEIARGLAAAHRRGVLHRDLKPANVMIASDGTVKLLDFGLAKLRPVDDREPIGDVADVGRDLDPAGSRRGEVAATADPAATTDPVVLRCDEVAGIEPRRPVDDGATVTRPGAILGTPRYMAPEQWRGEHATERTDVYALGAVLFELACGRPVHPSRDLDELRAAVIDGDAPPLVTIAPEIDPALAAVIDRALARSPALRPASADAMAQALATATDGAATAHVENPYRGLAAFSADDRALFFGRGADIGAIVDRLRSEQAVIIVGDSGVGKSSLCRAGVLPTIVAGGLGGARTWRAVAVRPGDDPAGATCMALGAASGVELADALGSADASAGLVVFVDQAEELITQCAPAVAAAFADTLVDALARDPGMRVIATVRGDFVARLAEVPALTALVTRGFYLVGALDERARREAIVGPAALAGVTFDEAAVDALVADSGGRGGLPLLQFALARLWQARPAGTTRITVDDVAAIGGVGGALARHADGVIAALGVDARTIARRLLTTLVTVDGTTAVRDAAELASDEPATAGVLHALVDGRLVVARDDTAGASYALAHDALIVHWATLSGWLADDIGARARRQRVAAAATEWDRLGRGRDGLLSGRPLADARALEGLATRELALVEASHRAITRRRVLAALLMALAVVTIATVWIGSRWAARRALASAVAGHLRRADELDRSAAIGRGALSQARSQAFAAFERASTTFLDADDARAETRWQAAKDQLAALRRTLRSETSSIESALLLETSNELRHRMAEVLYQLAVLADLEHDAAAVADLRERTATYAADVDARWQAPATLVIDVTPTASIAIRCRVPGKEPRVMGAPLFTATGAAHRVSVPSTTCDVDARAPGYVPVRAPVALAPAETLALSLTLPPLAEQPPGFVFVPAGRFLRGPPEPDSVRKSLASAPQHAVELPAFWIARHEVTFDDYIAFLEALPPATRAERRPRTTSGVAGGVALTTDPDGTWVIELRRGKANYRFRHEQPFRYEGRTSRNVQRWGKFPVAGVTIVDARAYAAWLDTTGRVAGARLCSDAEWERAARGADDRRYPHGDHFEVDDANHARTYGQESPVFGPDEVGSHPASDSPFGVQDLTGNVYEFVETPRIVVIRGGSWYSGGMSLWSAGRFVGEPTMRDAVTGIRICATAPNRH